MVDPFVDLTITYGGGRWSQPFLFEPPVVRPIHTHAEHGRSNTYFASSCHLGTHIDAPFHFVREGVPITHVSLERLIGEGLVLDLRADFQPGIRLTPDHLQTALGSRSMDGKIAVLYTGWIDRSFGTEDFYGRDHPTYTPEAADWLVERRPKALVVDTLIDQVEPPHPNDNPVHRRLLGAGIPLIENVINIDRLPAEGFRLLALPILIEGADGAPARVIAEVSA